MHRSTVEKSGRNHIRAAHLHKELADFHGRRANEVESKEHEAKHCALCDHHSTKQIEHDKIGRALLRRALGKVAAHERAKKISEHVREVYGNPEHNSFRPEKAREALERAIGEIHPRLTLKGLRGAHRKEHEVKASGVLSPVSSLTKKEQAAAHIKLGTLHGHLRDHALKNKDYDSAFKHSEKSINHHDVAHNININAPATHERLKRSTEANIVKHFGKGTSEHFRSHDAAKAANHIRKSLYGR